MSHLAMHLEGHLAELDINPLMVLPSGQGVKAVDALVVLSRHIALHVAECRIQKWVANAKPAFISHADLGPLVDDSCA